MMDDECRGVRQRRKISDPTCCPVCGITVRPNEMEQHYSMEMDRLNKLSIHKNRRSLQSKDMNSTVYGSSSNTNTSNSSSNNANESTASTDDKDCWNTYQRIKHNRSARLKVNQ